MPKPRRIYDLLLYICFLPALLVFAASAFLRPIPMHAAQSPHLLRSWSDMQEAISSAAPGDTITLTSDIAAESTDSSLSIPFGAVLTLDLNGYILDRSMPENCGNSGAVITVPSGAVLTVKDSSGSGMITGGNAPDGGGILNIGTLIMEGGCINGNISAEQGGGIGNYSLLVIRGGTVTGNTADVRGGGIFNGIKGRMTIVKDAVCGNDAQKDPDICSLGAMETVGGETVFYTALTDYMDTLSVLPPLVLLLVLFFAATLDNYLNQPQKRTMYIITVLVFVLVLQNCFESHLPGGSTLPRTVIAVIGYAVRPAILALYLRLIRPGRRYGPVWAAVGINAALYLTALFSPLTFFFSGGLFHAGPLHQSCLIISVILLVYCLYQTFKVFRPKERKETWIPVFAMMIIGLAVMMDYTVVYHYQTVSFLTIAITISSLMLYIWLHLQFVREHEKALQAEHRIKIMMTQIQPHFLFNTLTAIRALCIKDPKAAVRTIGLFSAYLRQNLESLNRSELIPLAEEIAHTRIYTEIEMIRFPNIRIEYDIRDEGCSAPPLTVQPLVENAVRHGVRSQDEGTVRITAYRENKTHLIVIADNGTGFDEQSANDTDGTYIGIRNVRERLAQMCQGTMTIDSRPGKGTKIVLSIPVNEEMNR